MVSNSRIALILAVAALAAPLSALEAGKWSKVENLSGKRQVVRISDLVKVGKLSTTVGALYVVKLEKGGDGKLKAPSGEGTKLSQPGNSTILDANSSYGFYFYTTDLGGQLALKFTVADEKDQSDKMEFRVSNIGSSVGAQEKLSLWAPSFKKSHMIVDPSGMRNWDGGTFLTIK